MPQQTLPVSGNAQLQVHACEDRVSITGWDDVHRVWVDGSARQEGDTIYIENSERVTLRVPRATTITITECEADVRLDDLTGRIELTDIEGDLALRNLSGEVLVRDLDGDLAARGVAALKGEGTWSGDASIRSTENLQANEIEGDVSLNDVGTVAVEEMGGDLAVRGARGMLRFGEIEGDVSLREIAGDVNLGHVGADLIGSGLQGNVNAEEVEGDAVLSLAQVQGILLRAEGDVVVNLPADSNADIELDAPHGAVVAQGVTRTTERDENHLRGTIGSGNARVQIESLHEDVVLRVGAEPGPRHVYGPEFHQEFQAMGREFAEMGRQIAEEARQSVQESLAGFKPRHPGKHHRHHWKVREETGTEPPAEPEEPKPHGPGAGSPERQAILDAIARGELSVDDAIRKIRGEE